MKKIFAFTTFVVCVLLLLVSCGTSIKGTYYAWNSYKYELDKSYSITFESKGQWHDTDGLSGTYEVDGSNISIYVTIMGLTEKMCDGIIGNGKFEYTIYETHTYYKEGYEPKKEDKVKETEDQKTEPATEDTSTEEPEKTTVTISFDTDGGSSIASLTLKINSKIPQIVSPTKDGYKFIGWYYENKEWDFRRGVNNDMTLVAKWELIQYTITFNINGHGEQPEQLICSHTLPQELPILSESRYVFFGWYLDEEFTNLAVGGTKISANTTLYAKWHKLNDGESEGLDIQGTKLVGLGTCTDVDIVIPDYVTEIGDKAFDGCTSIKNITIPSSVTHIGNRAFKDCTSLEKLNIPTSVTVIGSKVLENSISLKSLTIPFVGTSDSSHFGSLFASGLEYSAPQGTYKATFYTSIAYYYIPTSLTSVTVLAGEINEGAFANCKGLTKIELPGTLTNINEGTFKNCEGLTEIIIPDKVISIGDSAFADCENLSTVYNASDLVLVSGSKDYGKAGYYATSVYNKDEWEYIDGVPTPNVYSINFENNGCGEKPLMIVDVNVLPNEFPVLSQEGYEFVGWYLDTEFNVSAIPNSKISKDTVLYAKWDKLYSVGLDIQNNIVIGIGDCKDVDIIIPEGVIGIAEKAFYMKYIESIKMPNTIISIGDYAFWSCDLKSVEIPTSVEFIGMGAFKANYFLKNIILPNSLQKISQETFSYCNSLESIEIPNGVTCIESSAFLNCLSLKEIIIPDSVLEIGSSTFKDCGSLINVKISSQLSKISWGLFNGCSSLTSVTIPSSVTSINSMAFYGCESLTSIVVPTSVTYIERGAFEGCNNLSSITLPFIGEEANVTETTNTDFSCIFITVPESLKDVILVGATTIPENAFDSECCNIENITIPASVTSVGGGAFDGLANLKNVYYRGNLEQYLNISWGHLYSNPMHYAEKFYFLDDNNEYYMLTELVIPEGTTEIDDYKFYNWEWLKSITIPASATSIGTSAFYNCSNLERIVVDEDNEVYDSRGNCNAIIQTAKGNVVVDILMLGCKNTVIPDDVELIDGYAFYNCKDLDYIVIPDAVEIIFDTFKGCVNLKEIVLSKGVYWMEDDAFKDCDKLEFVYYKGTASDWEENNILSGNENFTSATIYYYSETEPTEEGNYWYYDADNNPVQW